jgi:hypothetical protein
MSLLTVNLEKKLLKQNKQLTTPAELLLIKEYEKIDKFDENKILSNIGLGDNIQKGKDIKFMKNRLKEETKAFNQERVFHISQIESLCVKYHLRFLPSHMFKGNLDEQLPYKVTTFETTYQKTCNSQNMYIVAPKKSFKLEERPTDPLLFYQINEDYYYLVHKWGNDLNMFRRIFGLLAKPALFWFTFILIFVFSVVIPATKNIHQGVAVTLIITVIISGFIVFVGGFGELDEYKESKKKKRKPNYTAFIDNSNWRSKFED